MNTLVLHESLPSANCRYSHVERLAVLIISPECHPAGCPLFALHCLVPFLKKPPALAEECDTWRLMACINDTPAGEREASFLPAKLCDQLGVSPQTTEQNKSSDRD